MASVAKFYTFPNFRLQCLPVYHDLSSGHAMVGKIALLAIPATVAGMASNSSATLLIKPVGLKS